MGEKKNISTFGMSTENDKRKDRISAPSSREGIFPVSIAVVVRTLANYRASKPLETPRNLELQESQLSKT